MIGIVAGSDARIMFIYWTALEGYRGQSLGKRAMNIKVTGMDGQKIGYGTAALESFGNAFIQ